MTTTQTSRAFRGLLATRSLGALADGAMLPFVIIWARRDAGLSGYVAGLLFLAQAIGELVGGLVGGALADRLGHRRVLLVSTVGMVAGYGSLAVVRQPIIAVTAFFVAGLFESAFHPTIAALIGELHESPQLPGAFALARTGANVGRIIGPIVGAAAVMVSLSAVFATAAILLAIAVAVIITTIPSDRVLHGTNDMDGADGEPDLEPSPAAFSLIFRDRRLGLLVAAGGLLSITVTWWEADGLVLLREQRSLSTTGYAALFTVAAVITVFLQLPTTRWAQRYSTGRVLILGAGAQAVGLAAFAAAFHGYAVMVAAVLAIALGQMLYSPTVSAVVTALATRGRGATYQAALSTAEDIGAAIGPTTGLALGSLANPHLVWFVAAPLCLVAGAAGARAVRRPPTEAATQVQVRSGGS